MKRLRQSSSMKVEALKLFLFKQSDLERLISCDTQAEFGVKPILECPRCRVAGLQLCRIMCIAWNLVFPALKLNSYNMFFYIIC